MTVTLGEDIGRTASDDARAWWQQRWGTLLGAYILSTLVGVAFAEWVRSSAGDWNHGPAWERALIVRMHPSLPGWVDSIVVVLPWSGTNLTLIPAITVLVWWIWRREHSPHDAMRLAIVQLGSYLLNPSLKWLYGRDRPDIYPHRGWYGWSSYPSGHAIATVAVLPTLAIILHRLKGWTWPYYVFTPIAIADLYSRIYLGVHWPTDVFAGMIVGLVWFFTTAYAFRERPNEATERSLS